MSIDGSWKLVTKSPMGDQKSTLSVQSQGSTLTGTMTIAGGQSDIENGTVEADQVSWSAKMTVPIPLKLEFKGVVAGDSLTGTVKVGAFGESPFSGVRA